MPRITRKDAEQALRVYCNRAGLPYGHYLTIKNNEELQHLIDTDPMRLVPAALFHVHDDGRRSYVLTNGLALDCAYGGYQVQQIIGTSNGDGRDGRPCTGVRTPFGGGYRSAREVFEMLNAATNGLELAERGR